RDPGEPPERGPPSGLRGARMGRSSAVVTEGTVEGTGATAMRCRVQRFRIIGRAAIATLARVTWTAAFLAAAPAMAAEVAVKAPWQAPIVQAYDWTGASSLDLDQSSDIFTG